jgi:pyridoxal phosphate enzyme (YggS family)
MLVESATIAANLERVRERIVRAATRAGRRVEEITLVAVTKTFPAEAVRAGYELGLRHFGENRVQEWESKRAGLVDLDAKWHLVGHLQSNKARRAAQIFHGIDSVDSVELAHKLARAIAESAQHRLSVLIEVRLSPEETKTGVAETDLPHLAEEILSEPGLDLRGLMAIPPFFDDPERTRPYFRRLCELRDSLRRHLSSTASAPTEVRATGTDRSEESLLPELSMGMSHDFEVAIEEGATQIRLGTALFGQRQLK